MAGILRVSYAYGLLQIDRSNLQIFVHKWHIRFHQLNGVHNDIRASFMSLVWVWLLGLKGFRNMNGGYPTGILWIAAN